MKRHQIIIACICIPLMLLGRYLPSVMGLQEPGMATLAIFIGLTTMLITISLTWPVLVSILAFAINGVYSIDAAIGLSIGSRLFWFCASTGMLFYIMNRTGIVKRIAVWFLTRPIVKRSPWILIFAILFTTLILGSFMDVNALILLMTALVAEMMEQAKIAKGSEFGSLLFICVMIMAGLSYGITPIGHPTAILAIDMLDAQGTVNFVNYSIIGIAMGLLLLMLLIIAMKFLFHMDVNAMSNVNIDVLAETKKPLSIQEKICVITYLLIMTAWLSPSILSGILPNVASFFNGLTPLGPIMIGLCVLCVIQIKKKPLVDFVDTVQNGVPWGAAFAMGAASMLGTAISNPEAGITDAISLYAAPLFSSMPPLVFVFALCLFCTVATNFSSDTVACMLASTIGLAIIGSGAITGIHMGALTICIGITSALAYATPSGSTYAAITSGTGWVGRKDQFVYGGSISVAFGILTPTVVYPIASMIL